MLDIHFIRENQDLVKKAAVNKRIACDVDRLLKIDRERVEVLQALEKLATTSREGGQQIALYRNPKSDWHKRAVEGGMAAEQIKAQADKLQQELNETKTQTKTLEEKKRKLLETFDELMLTIPQPPAPEVPIGEDETANVELRRVGEIPDFDFKLKDHLELGKQLGIIDIERGVKLAGSRNYVLRGDAALLHQAVLRLAQDVMIERGYVPMTVPVLVREKVMEGTGYFPVGRDQAYLCERDQMSLVGTAEVPLTAYHCDEILSEDELPKKYVAQSPCFRREAGAAGRDAYGLFRIHLFDKVEQVIVCRNDEEESKRFHREILQNSEDVVQALELPYRVVHVCTGDLGQGQVEKFDIEAWMPSRNSYGETHSASRFHEFQARRLMLRYRNENKKTRYCHTLNNTVIASPRILIPLLEIHQNADGSVTIPRALRKYMGDRDRIGP